MEAKKDLMLNELLNELRPEELEPRLELQILVDPLASFGDYAAANNCEKGSNCNIEGAGTGG